MELPRTYWEMGDIPDPDVDLKKNSEFTLTINSYEPMGSFNKCNEITGDQRPTHSQICVRSYFFGVEVNVAQ